VTSVPSPNAARRDAHTHARPAEARVTHAALELRVDFENSRIEGTATLALAVAPGAVELVLDTRRLDIRAIANAAGEALPYSLGPEDPVLGAALTVRLPEGTTQVVVDYATTDGAEALQWLSPAQTAGGERPFLFTQGQPIFARTWLPLQDSPAIRLTYEAKITVPEGLVALMSAERLPRAEGDPSTVFTFRMPEPIPAYLFALAVGDLACRELGPRSAVFAEPSVVDRAAAELVDVERMIDAGEALAGPYRWGRFDMVIMPPAFPYGGMENPRLTFASPTLIAGDRALVTVFAHELAHAWAGNLVINATWDDFWLNEGTTVYLELRMNEALWGAERAAMLRSWGHRELAATVAQLGATSPDTRLLYSMEGRDPAEGVTVIPYLKGAALFGALEAAVGRERLDAWLTGWFDRHAFRSVTTEDFVADVRERLFGVSDPSAPVPVDLDAWVSTPGLRDEAAPPPSRLLSEVDVAARALLDGGLPASVDARAWLPQQWRHLLALLVDARPALPLVEALDDHFEISRSGNAEVVAPWLRLEARVGRESAAPRIERFLLENGRTKYLRPLYAELLATPWGAPIARRVYAEARPRYHALARGSLDRLFASASPHA
jgi:leukotriene-A4 hydrolase